MKMGTFRFSGAGRLLTDDSPCQLASRKRAPPAFTFGNVGRNTVIGPGLNTLDMALIREFRVWESHAVQFRAEIFNSLNHTNYGTPNRYVSTPQFGTVTAAATPARQIQFSLRYEL